MIFSPLQIGAKMPFHPVMKPAALNFPHPPYFGENSTFYKQNSPFEKSEFLGFSKINSITATIQDGSIPTLGAAPFAQDGMQEQLQ
ncbi:MAG: hypothetical protein FWB75_06260 [Oscillospiraceae bacterium]|nr:hypothetical protein [Oscillospiraceae bacterium]